jgi:hypothetical protein
LGLFLGAEADTPVPYDADYKYNPGLKTLDFDVKWTWTSQSKKVPGFAFFADYDGNGLPQPSSSTSGNNGERDEYLAQFLDSSITAQVGYYSSTGAKSGVKDRVRDI